MVNVVQSVSKLVHPPHGIWNAEHDKYMRIAIKIYSHTARKLVDRRMRVVGLVTVITSSKQN